MIKIEYPPYQPKIKTVTGKECIFDAIRKRWVLLTPEEWVRQNFIQYLIKIKNFPPALIALEKEIQLGELKKRFDVLVYDNNHQPWMMIECKAAEIKLDDTVLQQALRYNISLQVAYIVITNGGHCYAFFCENNSLNEIDSLPAV